MNKKNIFIIGLGGIGCIFADLLSRFLASIKYDGVVTLVDGDDYESKNIERQSFISYGNKAISKCEEFKKRYPGLIFDFIPYYVIDENISKILYDNSTIFLAVDNHKTRKRISDFCEKLTNVDLISGGNDLTTGDSLNYIRRNSGNITPPITRYHPEISNPKDKSPDELSCEERYESTPQLLFTNSMAANCMTCSYYGLLNNPKFNYAEVYFDIMTMQMLSKIRPV